MRRLQRLGSEATSDAVSMTDQILDEFWQQVPSSDALEQITRSMLSNVLSVYSTPWSCCSYLWSIARLGLCLVHGTRDGL